MHTKLAAIFGLTVAAHLSLAQPTATNLRGWFDAADSSTITLEPSSGNTTVRQWRNKGSDAGSVANTTLAGQPAFLATAANGHPTLRFDGTNDVLRSLAYSSTPFTEFTAVIVLAVRADSGTFNGILSLATPTSSDYVSGINIDLGQPANSSFNYVNVEGARRLYLGGQNFRTSSNPFGTLHILRVNYTRRAVAVSVDGRQERTLCGNDASPLQATELRFGARSWAFPQNVVPFERSYGTIDLCEVLMYDRDFRCGELGPTLAYLSSKWGIPLLDTVDCCPADVDDGTGSGNTDCGITVDDLLYFLQLFQDGDPRADVDDGTSSGIPDGGVTIDDLLYFLDRYAGGC